MDLKALDLALAQPEPRLDSVEGVQAYADGFVNTLSGQGTNAYDRRNSSTFCPDLIDSRTALNMWLGSALAAKLIETFPKLGTRKGFTLKIQVDDSDESKAKDDPDKKDSLRHDAGSKAKDALDRAERIQNDWERLGVKEKLREWAQFGRAFGGGLMLLGVKGQEAQMSEPLDMATVRSLDWITVFEADDFTPVAWYANPMHPKYNEPAIFQISPNTPGNSVEPNQFLNNNVSHVHESRCIYHPGVRLSNRQTSRSGHGESVLTRAYRLILNSEQATDGIAYLLQNIGIPVFKIKGLAKALMAGDKSIIPNRMRAMQLSTSAFRARLMDLDEISELMTTPLSGVSENLDRVNSMLASAFEMPVTFLFGTSPGGLNATGESDIRGLYDNVLAWSECELVPALRRITEIQFAAERAEPENWSIEPVPLYQLTEKEIADTRKVYAEIDKINIDAQVYEPIDVTRSRYGGDKFGTEMVVDIEEMERLAAEPDPEPMDPIAAMAAAALEGEGEGDDEPPKPGEPEPDDKDDPDGE